MRKIFSIISAFIFLFGAAGYYLAFTIADQSVQHDMAKRIQSPFRSSNQVLFTFTNDQLRREVRFTEADQKEFIYQGEHYDVIKVQRTGEKTFFTCIADRKETSLFTSFTKQLDGQPSPQNTSGKTSVKPLMQDWFYENQEASFPFAASSLPEGEKQNFLPKILFKIPSPPPKS